MSRHLLTALLSSVYSKSSSSSESADPDWTIVHILVPGPSNSTWKSSGELNRICFKQSNTNNDTDPTQDYYVKTSKNAFLNKNLNFNYTCDFPRTWGFADSGSKLTDVSGSISSTEVDEDINFNELDPEGRPLMVCFSNTGFNPKGNLYYFYNCFDMFSGSTSRAACLYRKQNSSGYLNYTEVKLPDGTLKSFNAILTVAIRTKQNLLACTCKQFENSLADKIYFIEDKTSKIEDLYNDYKNEIMKTDFTGDYLMGIQDYLTNSYDFNRTFGHRFEKSRNV